MTYSTVEAHIKDTTVTFPRDFRLPQKNVRVLVTFIESDDVGRLYELPKNQVTHELQFMSDAVLEKDTSLFTNI